MTGKYKLIIFDFDGVIADGMENNFPEILKKSNRLTKKLGIQEFKNVEEFKTFASLKFSEKITYLSLHKKQYPTLFTGVFKILKETIRNSRLFPGIKSTMKTLKKDGYILAIATRNRGWLVKLFLVKNRIKTNFKTIVGRSKNIDKAKNLELLIKKHNVNKSQVLFVTDTVNDVEDGHRVGIDILAVSYGIDTQQDLQKAKVTFMANSPEEILNFVQ